MRRSFGFAVIAATLALTTACGGGGGRPSESEVSKAISSEDSALGTEIPKKQADCFAKLLVDSKVSDKTLNALVEGDKDYEGSDKDRDALQAVGTKFVSECATAE
jgi:hypothetical protein